MSGATLAVDRVVRTFGGIRAVDDVTFDVGAGETVGVIGPNGAGKTALLNVVCGVYRAEAGTVLLDGARISGLRPHEIAALGVARTFQSTEQVHEFRALEYVMLGRMRRQPTSLLACALGLPRVRAAERSEAAVALRSLARLGLEGIANEHIGELPFGMQKLVDIARALAAEPALLALDEPTSGTTAAERASILAVLRAVGASGVTMLVVDHDVQFISTISGRLLVMNYGKVLAQGRPADVLARSDVIEAYVGL